MEVWRMVNGQRTTDNGEATLTTDNRQRSTDNSQRTTDNGQQSTDNGQRTTDLPSGVMIDVCCLLTEDYYLPVFLRYSMNL